MCHSLQGTTYQDTETLDTGPCEYCLAQKPSSQNYTSFRQRRVMELARRAYLSVDHQVGQQQSTQKDKPVQHRASRHVRQDQKPYMWLRENGWLSGNHCSTHMNSHEVLRQAAALTESAQQHKTSPMGRLLRS